MEYKYTQLQTDKLMSSFKNRLGNSEVLKKIKNSQIYDVFMEFLTECCDLSNFYTQRIAEECNIKSAKIESNVIKHCHNLGYQPRRPIPAQAELIIRLKGPFPDEINSAGVEIFFPQSTTDLSYNGHKYKLDSSYSYVLSQEDIDYCHNVDWEKNLVAAVPHNNSIFLPLQGINFVNAENVTPIKCFQGEIKQYVIEGGSVLKKIGKSAQTFNIPDPSFSDWYGKRDPYAYNGDRNFIQKNSWCKVGIGSSHDDALSDESLFNIETQSINLNKFYRELEVKDTSNLETLLHEVNSHNQVLDKKWYENKIKDLITNQLKICTITSNPDKTVKIAFGKNHLVVNGLMRPTDNLYVDYISTSGKEANQANVFGAIIDHSNKIYASINGNIIDITGNVEFVLNSDIFGGDDFESIDSMKINGPAYYRRRNKLIMLEDFQNYFSTLTSPMYVNTACAAGQQEIEESQLTNTEFPCIQNCILYTLLGRLYLQNEGNWEPRNIYTEDDVVSEPYSLYGKDYKDHIPDLVKYLISPSGYYEYQYRKVPKEQWVKSAQLIRENCKDNLPMNTTLLSMPPFIHYFDLVGSVNVKPTTDMQEYNLRLKNKIYSYLNTKSKETQKVYKSDLIKIYADDPDTLNVDIDIKVSSLIKAPEQTFTWSTEYKTILEDYRQTLVLDTTLPNFEPIKALGNDARARYFNQIKLQPSDDIGKKITEAMANNSRMELKFIFTDGFIAPYTLSNEAIITKNDDGNEILILTTPILCTIPNAQFKSSSKLARVEMVIKTEHDFYSTSKLSSINYTDYKLPAYNLSHPNQTNASNDPISHIKDRLVSWLQMLRETHGADRAIDLPYNVRFGINGFARQEQILRKGNIIGENNETLSESAFWNYFAPTIIREYYRKPGQNGEIVDMFTNDSIIDSDEWKGAAQLLYDLYALVKPGISDSILDDNNNITNFSLSTEAAVVINKVNVLQY